MKILYIDACIREELSRTKKIATPIINKLKEKHEVETLTLNELDLQIVDKALITKRNNKEIDDEVLSWAHKVASADKIVIAAPFWDMSFPAALKNFFELCSIFEVTFSSNEKECYGLCKADTLLYITTRGMNIHTGEDLEAATPYLKAKEDKENRIVISPYASLMAMELFPEEVYENIQKFKNLDMFGKYGMYEAYDYDNRGVVKAFFAHHQGMSLAGIVNYLKPDAIKNYFHENVNIKTFEVLLKEKVLF